jgi:hypothetical protein
MKPIEELFADGDFDAIRQLLDEVEAEQEAKAKAAREAQVSAAKEKVVAATREYMEVLGLDYNEKEIDSLVKALDITEAVALKKPAYKAKSYGFGDLGKFSREDNKPIVISTTGNADDILRAFLEREI